MYKKIIYTTAVVLLITFPLRAELDEKTVTYSDFQFVRFVASSLTHAYFATSSGIIRYHKMEKRWEEPLTSSDGIDHFDIQRIYVDEFDTKILAQTSMNKYEYDLMLDNWHRIDDFPQITTNYQHVRVPSSMFFPAGFNFSPDGFFVDPLNRDFYISDIIDDRNGLSWIGTYGYGAATAPSSSYLLEFLPYGLIQNWVDAIYNDNGLLLVSGRINSAYIQRTGITIFDPDNNSFEHIESGFDPDFPEDDVNCFAADDEFYYVGTSSGRVVIDKEEKQPINRISSSDGLPDIEILSLELLGDSLFIGTIRGPVMLNLTNDSLTYIRHDQFANQDIYDFEPTDSSLWIASSSGAYQLNLKTKQLQKFQDPNSIIFNRCLKIRKFDDELWLASDGGFVKVNLKTGETYGFDSITGGMINKAMDANETVAAVASDNGFKLIYHKDNKFPTEVEFTTDDGLPSNYVNALLLDGDFLWIGTDKGLTRFMWNNPYRVD